MPRDLDGARAWCRANVSRTRATKLKLGDESDYPDLQVLDKKIDGNQARARRDLAMALKAEIENKRILGQLLDATEVSKKYGKALGVVRLRMLQIGSKVAPQLAVMDSPVDIKEVIDDEVCEALEALSEYGNRGRRRKRTSNVLTVTEAAAEINTEPVGE